MADEQNDAPREDEQPQEDAPEADAPQNDAPQEEALQDDAPQEEPAAEEAPPAAESAAEERQRPKKEPKKEKKEEVVPGAHLEPDLVLDEEPKREQPQGEELAEYATEDDAEAGPDADADAPPVEADPESTERTPLELAADARYIATGKRKTSVARVILKPGSGTYTINGRKLEEYFPRTSLQNTARGPLQTVGQEEKLDVSAKIHGGGVSSQAGALRHGVARALVEADPALRAELKKRGFLTRDARAKERYKAGLKKARKRPQFSKR